MKTIEIRRHSIRTKPGQNLSQEGVSLARMVGEPLGRFERVVSSPIPRAFQTAIAMGYAVDETDELLSTFGEEVENECPWTASFNEYAAAVRKNGAAARYAARLANFYSQLLERLSEGGSALVITHGGVVELSAAGCLPGTDLGFLGDYVECCEGVRLTWDNGAISAKILRV